MIAAGEPEPMLTLAHITPLEAVSVAGIFLVGILIGCLAGLFLAARRRREDAGRDSHFSR